MWYPLIPEISQSDFFDMFVELISSALEVDDPLEGRVQEGAPWFASLVYKYTITGICGWNMLKCSIIGCGYYKPACNYQDPMLCTAFIEYTSKCLAQNELEDQGGYQWWFSGLRGTVRNPVECNSMVFVMTDLKLTRCLRYAPPAFFGNKLSFVNVSPLVFPTVRHGLSIRISCHFVPWTGGKHPTGASI